MPFFPIEKESYKDHPLSGVKHDIMSKNIACEFKYFLHTYLQSKNH